MVEGERERAAGDDFAVHGLAHQQVMRAIFAHLDEAAAMVGLAMVDPVRSAVERILHDRTGRRGEVVDIDPAHGADGVARDTGVLE